MRPTSCGHGGDRLDGARRGAASDRCGAGGADGLCWPTGRSEYAFGLARIEFMGEVTAGRVLFGPEDAEPLLGVVALKSVGITVDPVSRTLKRLPAIPLKSLSMHA